MEDGFHCAAIRLRVIKAFMTHEALNIETEYQITVLSEARLQLLVVPSI